jgi:putative inorganic carbon (HCO3(-)) transporter
VSAAPIGSPGSRRLQAWVLAAVAACVLAVAAVTVHPIIFAVPVAIAGGMLLLRWPLLAMVAMVASVPAQQLGQAGPLTVTRLFVLLAVYLTITLLLLQRRPVTTSWLALPFALYIMWMSIAATGAQDQGLAQAEIMRWLVAFIALLVVLQYVVDASPRVLVGIVVTVGVVAGMQALLGIVQSLLTLGPPSFQVVGSLSRAYGTFGRPNTFAGYLEMALFPVLWVGFYQAWLAWQSIRRYRRVRPLGFVASHSSRAAAYRSAAVAGALLVPTLLILAGIGISFSRGAWIGVLAGLLVTAGIALRRFALPIAAALPPIALLVLLVGSAATPAALGGRVASIAAEARPFDASTIPITHANFATVERMAHWQAAWHMFLDYPLTGVGPGNFNARYGEYFVRAEFRFSQGHAHNYYLHALAETGLPGLLAYLALTLGALGIAVRVAWSASGLAKALALGAAGTTMAVLTHNVFENLHVLNLGIQLSATWGLAVAAHRMHARSVVAGGDVEYSRA